MKTGQILQIVGCVIGTLMAFVLFTKHPVYGVFLTLGVTLYIVGTKLGK